MKWAILVLVLAVTLAGCKQAPAPVPEQPAPRLLDSVTISSENPGKVKSQMVEYYGNTEGYLSEPDQASDYPGIILIHEWWGLNENMKATADRLAANGYRVLAVDLYDGKVATTREEAQLYRSQTDPLVLSGNIDAARAYLRETGSDKIASWGYCFGGGESMRYALSGVTDATVVYYGDLTPAILEPQAVTAPLFMVYGDQDTNTPASSAQELEGKLKPYGVPVELHIYPGVGHAFANPSNAGHHPAFTQDSWQKTVAFLDRELK